MHELIRQILDEVRAALRFRWYGMLLAWIVGAGGIVWVVGQPDIYQANASLYVDTSSVLRPVLGNRIVSPDVATQLAYVREALLGREQMEAVARATGLDLGATTTAQFDSVIANLQSSVQVQLARGARNSADGTYTISYRNADRNMAVSVVDAVVDSFSESAIGLNRQQGDTAEEWIEARIAEYELRLEQAEEARARFLRENADRLPGNQGGYYQRLRNEQDALSEARRQLAIVESRRDERLEQLNGESEYVPDGGVDAAPPANSTEARIRQLETRLDDLLINFTETYPDVVNTREALGRLREQRAQELAALGIDADAQELIGLAANPIFMALQIAIQDAEAEIATLEADIALRSQRIADLQSLVNEIPGIEAELEKLNRDYNAIEQTYFELVRGRETQGLSRQALDADQIDFDLINPPLASPNPVAPNRLLLFVGVFVASIGSGAALCYLLAQLRPVFHSTNVLRQKTGLPVLGAVAFAWPERLRSRRRTDALLYAGAGGCLLLAFGALVLLEFSGSGVDGLLRAASL